MNQLEVTIDQGTLRGSIGTDLNGKKFYKFQGIPYAQPPLGQLRFKAPQPSEKWIGTFNATQEGNPCCQKDPLKKWATSGSEDCLYLNVYTKKPSDEELKPVLFWIHGGAFVFGHGGEEYYGPDFLMIEDVVLVTINYRLGLFGFLNFEDPSLNIPGNAGFKDQVMALKWVQENISKFGGDPNNVTIFGESAGGASVHLHVLSPMSKGLFHKAIAQSGCALLPGLGATPKISVGHVLGIADEKQIYDTLMGKSAEEILGIQYQMSTNVIFNEPRPIGAVVEKNSREPFLAEPPIDIIKSGKFNQVPFLTGYTNAEGMLYELLKGPKWTPDFEDVIPHSFGYEKGSPEKKGVAQKLKTFYFGEGDVGDNATKKYEMLGDSNFVFPIYKTIWTQLPASENPIYVYRVTVESELNYMKKILKIQEKGVSHVDDLGYLFKTIFTPEIKPGSVEDVSIRRFVRLWANFAKWGNPTPNRDPLLDNLVWKSVSDVDIRCLDIGKDLVLVTNPDQNRMRFWNQLFGKKLSGPT